MTSPLSSRPVRRDGPVFDRYPQHAAISMEREKQKCADGTARKKKLSPPAAWKRSTPNGFRLRDPIHIRTRARRHVPLFAPSATYFVFLDTRFNVVA